MHPEGIRQNTHYILHKIAIDVDEKTDTGSVPIIRGDDILNHWYDHSYFVICVSSCRCYVRLC